MDERQTLLLLGWIIGGVVGSLFFLNALALADIANQTNGTAKTIVAGATLSPTHQEGPSLQ